MVLRRFWSSLANILKSSIETVWPEMLMWLCIGEGAFRCSLNLSQKFLADSPIYSSSHSTLVAFESVYDPTSCKNWIFILRDHKEVLDGRSSFEVHFYAIFLASPLETLTQPLMVWNSYMWFWSLLLLGLEFLLLFFFLGAGVWFLNFTLLRAHVGYLHFFKVLYKCSSSSCSWVGPEQMVLALWNRVPILLYLDGMAWWLSQCRYWFCMCWLSVDSGLQPALFIWNNQHIQKGDWTIFTRIFWCKLNAVVDGVQVI